jgi:hypothetical protein
LTIAMVFIVNGTIMQTPDQKNALPKRDCQKELSEYAQAVNPAVWRAMEVSLPRLHPAQVLVFPQSSHGASRVL